MDTIIVNDYVALLKAALGDADAFARVYAKLEHDKAVRQAEAAGIAKLFTGDASKSTPRVEALRRIRMLQVGILDVKAKKRAQLGRSAA
jgi:hypothetical protein